MPCGTAKKRKKERCWGWTWTWFFLTLQRSWDSASKTQTALKPRRVKVSAFRSRLSFCDLSGLLPARLLCPWDSPGKNTRVGCHSLLQGIFPTQGLNLGLLYRRQIFLLYEPSGKPSMLSKNKVGVYGHEWGGDWRDKVERITSWARHSMVIQRKD